MGLIVKPVKAPVQTSPVSSEIDGSSLPYDAGEGAGALLPLNILTNVEAWYRADQVTIATGVSSWTDLTGNGHHATQGTTSLQPPQNTSDADFNGQATIDFAGGDYLVIPHAASLGNANDRHVFVIMSAATPASDGEFISKLANPFEWSFRINTSGQLRGDLRDGDDNSFAIATDTTPIFDDATQPRLAEGRIDVSACDVGVRTDGGSFVTATDVSPANIAVSGDVGIGARSTGTVALPCTIAEIIVCNAIQSDTRVASLKSAYLTPRYGLPFA